MQITEATKYAEFEPVEKYVKPKAVQRIFESAEEKFGKMYDLEFGTFWQCSNENFAEVLGDMSEPTVLQVYWKKRFEKFVEEFAGALKAMTLTQTAEEIQAADGLLKISWDEAILVFVRDYFGLHSFKDAERITMGEILIAKRAVYNREKFQRKLAKIQTAKLHKK